MTSQNGVKKFFFASDERRPLTNIKQIKLSKHLISIKRYNCYNFKICY